MNQSLTPEQEKELQEIVNLAKIAEDKLKQTSDFATRMVEKHEHFYKQNLETKQVQ